jgi:hypothetical protein
VYPDGGVQQTPFISEPALVWHDGAHNGHTDVQPFAGALFAVFRQAPPGRETPPRNSM